MSEQDRLSRESNKLALQSNRIATNSKRVAIFAAAVSMLMLTATIVFGFIAHKAADRAAASAVEANRYAEEANRLQEDAIKRQGGYLTIYGSGIVVDTPGGSERFVRTVRDANQKKTIVPRRLIEAAKKNGRIYLYFSVGNAGQKPAVIRNAGPSTTYDDYMIVPKSEYFCGSDGSKTTSSSYCDTPIEPGEVRNVYIHFTDRVDEVWSGSYASGLRFATVLAGYDTLQYFTNSLVIFEKLK